MTARRCDNPGCAGHLGKYRDCLTEALHWYSLEWADDTCGSVEFEGHFAIVELDEDTALSVATEQHSVFVPHGAYLIHEHDDGTVSLAERGDPAWAHMAFGQAAHRYATWLDDEPDPTNDESKE